MGQTEVRETGIQILIMKGGSKREKEREKSAVVNSNNVE